jgi:hypothetical protein
MLLELMTTKSRYTGEINSVENEFFQTFSVTGGAFILTKG